MELQGRIEFISALEKGQDKNGKDYEKAYFVISDEVGQYPNRYKIELFNKTDLMSGVKLGDRVKVQINSNVKEYNSKHYGSMSAYKIELEITQYQQVETVQPIQTPPPTEKDLPF